MARWNGSNTFTAESLRQLQMIEECAANMGLFVRVLLRVTSGNQFGMDEALISEIVETRNRYPSCHDRRTSVLLRYTEAQA